jgi:hypothetical protein
MPKIQAVKRYTYVVPENETTQNSNVDCRQIQASRSGPFITEEPQKITGRCGSRI